ncbi:MAG: hypothetical protein V3S64_10845 [bacterium]
MDNGAINTRENSAAENSAFDNDAFDNDAFDNDAPNKNAAAAAIVFNPPQTPFTAVVTTVAVNGRMDAGADFRSVAIQVPKVWR